MEARRQMKGQLAAMIIAGLAVTVFAALHQNTVLAIIIFVVQGTLGSTINAKYQNEAFREISEIDEGVYGDVLAAGDISPKTAEREGRAYPEAVAVLLNEVLLVRRLNKWMPFAEMLLFFALQLALFSKL